MTRNATLVYEAIFDHPDGRSLPVLWVDVAADLEWEEEHENHFRIIEVYLDESTQRTRLHSPHREWVIACIQRDRKAIAGELSRLPDGWTEVSLPGPWDSATQSTLVPDVAS